MKRVCLGCGSEIPEDSDFCYACGRWAKDALNVDDKGNLLVTEYCLNCGEAMPANSAFCPYCGYKVESRSFQPVRPYRRKMTNTDILAILLAVIPGFINVFGLGQIVLKRWSRAFTYLCLTVLLFYLAPSFLAQDTTRIIHLVLQLIIFIFSIQDVLNAIQTRGA